MCFVQGNTEAHRRSVTDDNKPIFNPMGIFCCLESFGEKPYVSTSHNMWEDREAQNPLYQNAGSEDKRRKNAKR